MVFFKDSGELFCLLSPLGCGRLIMILSLNSREATALAAILPNVITIL